jgi:hypothetical protein
VHFDAITAGVHGMACRLAEIVHDARQFIESQRPWNRNVLEPFRSEGLGMGAARSARDGLLAIGQQRSVGDPSYMPQLYHEPAPLGVHGL